jgi:hypothetical protein
VTDPSGVVFLSYASQDAQAAQKICEALRAAGIEVFLDQSALRGGDAWDQKIRREIRDCALFIPVISAHTVSRHEGYFRLEWDLADQRTHMIARNRAFIVPACVDATPESSADIPESFQRVQWTRLPGGETPAAFVERIKRLLSPELSPLKGVSGAAPGLKEPVRASRRSKPVLLAIVAVVLAALAYFVADKFWISKHLAASTAFNPPSHCPGPNLLRLFVFILKLGYNPKTRIFAPCAEGWLPVRNRYFGSVQANAICSQCRIQWFVRSALP